MMVFSRAVLKLRRGIIALAGELLAGMLETSNTTLAAAWSFAAFQELATFQASAAWPYGRSAC